VSQSAAKVLQLAEVVARSGSDGLSSTQAALACGLDKTTVSRLLRMLTERGWLTRDAATRRYSSGPVLSELADATRASRHGRAVIESMLRGLRDSTNESVALYEQVGHSRVCTVAFESPEELRSAVHPGELRALDRGASGRVILAFCPQPLQDEIVRAQPDRAAQRALSDQLAAARADGHLSIDPGDPGGSAAIAVPVFGAQGIHGSLAISGPVTRFPRQTRGAWLPAMYAVATRLTESLGGAPQPYEHWQAARLDSR
jgi:DNA-binding IclR family transcriptional regulator